MATKKASVKKQSATAKTVAAKKKSAQPLIDAQPQSKQAAAQAAGMFLKNDDSWSNAYWTNSDLHFKERELFG